MRRISLVLGSLLFMASAGIGAIANAGPNAGGTVLVSWNSAFPYQKDAQYFEGGLTGCSVAVVQAPPAVQFPPPDSQRRIWFAYAAFPPGSLPRLKGVSFGIKFRDFNDGAGVRVLWAAVKPGVIEFPSPGWPVVPNSGNVLVFPEARTGEVEELCVFAGYGSAGALFGLGHHPSIRSQFADDLIPPTLDDIADFGSIGFGVDGRLPCPGAASGACCRALDGACLILSPVDCQKVGGTYLGNDIVCEPNPCPQPRGACCFENGNCEVQTAAACAEYGGSWMGAWTVCDPGKCPPPPPSGACCQADGACRFVRQDQCDTGDWRQDVPCDPNPCPQTWGACCNLETAVCEILSLVECEDASYPHVWMGALVECTPALCPPAEVYGACCLSGNACAYVTRHNCPSVDWRPNEPCDPNPCLRERGACCFHDNTCDFVYRDECVGHFWADQVCRDIDCPFLEYGACCDLVTGVCLELTESSCADLGDNHWWAGVYTECTPGFCVSGSCCQVDGACFWTVQYDCISGTWIAGETCDPNPCPQPGACCRPDGECVLRLEELCQAPNRWAGGPCAADLCQPVPVERTSWGVIKTRFR